MHKVLALFLSVIASAAFAAVTPLPGSAGQSAIAGQPFAAPIGVRVTDNMGRPAEGVDVTFRSFTIHGGGLELNNGVYSLVVKTDFDGAARLGPGPRADSGTFHSISADTPNPALYGYAIMDFYTGNVVVGPSRVSALSATEQTVTAGNVLPETLRVRVTAADGTPLRGVLVKFTPDINAVMGSFAGAQSATVATDINGIAEAPPYTTSLEPGRGQMVALHVGGLGQTGDARFFFTNTAPATRPVNYQDMWWGGPEQNGWGVSVVEHDRNFFVVVFAYDDNGAPTWHVVSQASWIIRYGFKLSGLVYRPRGTPYYAYDATRFVVGPSHGISDIAFIGGKEARLFLEGAHFGGGIFPTAPGQPMVRQEFTVSPDIPLRGVGDMWWGGPGQNGWGIAIHEQPGALFSVWFTYGDDGNPTWFVMPGGTWTGPNEYSGQIYRTHASAWLKTPYDATKLQVIPVGTYRLRFSSAAATFDYNVDGHSGTLPITRQPF